jgi:rod shape-determining protein MreD
MKTVTSLIIVIISFFLALIQTSFFSYPGLLGGNLNLIFLLVIILSFSENKSNRGLWAGFWGGLFLDFFSAHFFGSALITLSSTAIVAKKISGLMQKSLPAKISLFLISFLFYQLISWALILFFSLVTSNFSLQLNQLNITTALVSFGYHLLIFIILSLLSQPHQKKNYRYGYF